MSQIEHFQNTKWRNVTLQQLTHASVESSMQVSDISEVSNRVRWERGCKARLTRALFWLTRRLFRLTGAIFRLTKVKSVITFFISPFRDGFKHTQ